MIDPTQPVDRLYRARRLKAIGLILIGSSVAIYPPVMIVRGDRLGGIAYLFMTLMLIEITIGVALLVKGINLQKEEQQNG